MDTPVLSVLSLGLLWSCLLSRRRPFGAWFVGRASVREVFRLGHNETGQQGHISLAGNQYMDVYVEGTGGRDEGVCGVCVYVEGGKLTFWSFDACRLWWL